MAKKILIVDDDYAILESLQFLLEDAGYEVFAFVDGMFMNNINENHMPDLILLDYWLPKQNGGELTKKLKMESMTKKIPIIIISASYNIRELVINAGADDFVSKPYDIDTLLALMKKYLID